MGGEGSTHFYQKPGVKLEFGAWKERPLNSLIAPAPLRPRTGPASRAPRALKLLPSRPGFWLVHLVLKDGSCWALQMLCHCLSGCLTWLGVQGTIAADEEKLPLIKAEWRRLTWGENLYLVPKSNPDSQGVRAEKGLPRMWEKMHCSPDRRWDSLWQPQQQCRQGVQVLTPGACKYVAFVQCD